MFVKAGAYRSSLFVAFTYDYILANAAAFY
jgi:hypothetical protein